MLDEVVHHPAGHVALRGGVPVAVALAVPASPGTIIDVRLTARDGDRMIATPIEQDIAA